MKTPGPIASTLMLIVLIALPQLVGYVGSSLTFISVETWYAGLEKPPLNPPNWAFDVVWTALFFIMGLASWIYWRAAGGIIGALFGLTIYGAQLGLNLSWSYFFFALQNAFAGLLVLIGLFAAIVVTTLLFSRKSRTAAYLMVPYILWVLFAGYLNAGIVLLNG